MTVRIERLEGCDDLVLESDDAMAPAGLKRGVFIGGVKAEKIVFATGREDSNDAWCSVDNVSDVSDPLRMLKHALIFVGGASRWRGIRLFLCNRGVSRSGFASSSAVAVNLLAALYRACGVTSTDRIQLGSLSLLFENQLGLKSGRQDVDGPLLPGLKHLIYHPTSGVVVPEVEELHVPLNLVLVDTGVRRPAETSVKRGLNMRHLAFLSREPHSFLSIRKSLGIHVDIVDAVRRSDWPLLGFLFAEYMALRESIDPGATGPRCELRIKLFDRVKNEQLVYGGMFSGAMGGGIAMFVPVPGKAEELEKRLSEIAKEDPLFASMTPIKFSVNTKGIQIE